MKMVGAAGDGAPGRVGGTDDVGVEKLPVRLMPADSERMGRSGIDIDVFECQMGVVMHIHPDHVVHVMTHPEKFPPGGAVEPVGGQFRRTDMEAKQVGAEPFRLRGLLPRTEFVITVDAALYSNGHGFRVDGVYVGDTDLFTGNSL